MQNYIRLTNDQIVKCGPHEGKPLPRMETPEILRTCRSKYAPHVGHKQEVKQLSRPENALALMA